MCVFQDLRPPGPLLVGQHGSATFCNVANSHTIPRLDITLSYKQQTKKLVSKLNFF